MFYIEVVENGQQLVQNLIKLTRSQKLQIVYGNEKLNTMVSQVNASQISQQPIANSHSGFQPLANIITEKHDIIDQPSGHQCKALQP